MGLSTKKMVAMGIVVVAIVGTMIAVQARTPVETCVWPHLCSSSK